MFERFPGHSSVLRCAIHRLHVGFRRGILHYSRFPVATVLPHSAVLLHYRLYAAAFLSFADIALLGLFQGSREVYALADHEWIVSSCGWMLRTFRCRAVWLLW